MASNSTSFDLNIDDIIEAYERCAIRTNARL